MNDTELNKLAATAIRQLQSENENLQAELSKQKEAVKLAFDLSHKGIISAEQLESKIAEFVGKTEDDLRIIKTAAEISRPTMMGSAFKSSSFTSHDSRTAEEKFTDFLLYDD